MAFWDELSEDDRGALDGIGAHREHGTGAVIFMEGERATTAVVVLDGRVKLTRTALDGRQVLIELRGPGELVGELGVIDDAPRSATAVAAERLTVLVVPAEPFRRVLAERGSIALAVLSAVAVKLRETAGRRLESGTTDATTRLCARLVQLAAERGPAGGGHVEIESTLTQQELAEWIGVSRDAVVLALRRLRDLGWIETGRRRITILDLDAVRTASVT